MLKLYFHALVFLMTPVNFNVNILQYSQISYIFVGLFTEDFMFTCTAFECLFEGFNNTFPQGLTCSTIFTTARCIREYNIKTVAYPK